jgi:hypothetical protein
MKKLASVFGLRLTTGHLLWAAVLIPACLVFFIHIHLTWLAITLAVLIAIATVLTVRGRRITGWIAVVFAWRRRHQVPPAAPSVRR